MTEPHEQVTLDTRWGGGSTITAITTGSGKEKTLTIDLRIAGYAGDTFTQVKVTGAWEVGIFPDFLRKTAQVVELLIHKEG